jgi:hypothetical protein
MKTLPLLKSLNACGVAVAWAAKHEDLQDAREACKSGEWLLWLASRAKFDTGSELHRQIVRAGAHCSMMSTVNNADEDIRTDVEAVLAELVAWSFLCEIDTTSAEGLVRSAVRSAESAERATAWSDATAAWATRSAAQKHMADIVRTHVDFDLVLAGFASKESREG